jgi:hypothetical protein
LESRFVSGPTGAYKYFQQMLLGRAGFKRVRGFDAEWKLLRRPAEHNQVDIRP